MMSNPIPMGFFVPTGNALLLVTGGLRIAQCVRKDRRVEPAFVAMAVAFLGLTFYSEAFKWVLTQSEGLEKEISALGDSQSIKDLVWESITASANNKGLSIASATLAGNAFVESIFRAGLWGVFSSIGDLIFVLAEGFIRVRREFLLTLIEFLFPLICGVYPLLPRYGNAILGYVVEIFLWGPCLVLFLVLSGYVGHRYLAQPGTILPIAALEIIVGIMLLGIPSTVHSLLGGTLFPGGESGVLGLLLIGAVKPLVASQVVKPLLNSAPAPTLKNTLADLSLSQGAFTLPRPGKRTML